jgi:hypothetical protein
LRLYDVQSGKDIWKKSIDAEAVALNSLVDEWAGFIDSKGKLSVFEVSDGKEVLTGEVDATTLKSATDVHLLRDASQIFVAFNNALDQNANQKDRRQVYDYNVLLRSVRVNGPLYAFDRATSKERWRRDLPPHAMIVDQFEDLPLILFASMQMIWVQLPGANAQPPVQQNKNCVMAIDRRDGRDGRGGQSGGGKDEVYKDESTARSGLQYYLLRADPRQSFVELFGQNYKIQFKATSEQAKEDADGKPRQGAQAPVEPRQELPIRAVLPGQIRLQQQQAELIRLQVQLQLEAERARAAAEEAARKAEQKREKALEKK